MGKSPTSKVPLCTGWSEGSERPEAGRPAPGGPMRPPGGGVGGSARPPFPSGRRRPRPLGRRDVRAFHGCYSVARGGAPVREAARGGGGGLRLQRGVPAPAPVPRPALSGPPPCVLARQPALPPCPCAARVWSCCAARAPGTRPGPGRTRGCWGTSGSCRACSAWRSAMCPAPPTSNVCRGRSSRTCGRCWRTGCWRYRPDWSPLPRHPCVPQLRTSRGRPVGTSWSQQQSSRCFCGAHPRGLALRSRTLAGCLPGGPFFLFSNPGFDCQSFGTLTNPLLGRESGTRATLSPPASPSVSCLAPLPGPLWRARLENLGLSRPRRRAGSCVCRGVLAGKAVGVARAVPAVREMKSAGGRGWSLLPSLWVCAVGGGNGGKVPVLWLQWVTRPSPIALGMGEGRLSLESLREPLAYSPPLPSPGCGGGGNVEEVGGASPWGRRILRFSPCHCKDTYPLPFLAPPPNPFPAPPPNL